MKKMEMIELPYKGGLIRIPLNVFREYVEETGDDETNFNADKYTDWCWNKYQTRKLQCTSKVTSQ